MAMVCLHSECEDDVAFERIVSYLNILWKPKNISSHVRHLVPLHVASPMLGYLRFLSLPVVCLV